MAKGRKPAKQSLAEKVRELFPDAKVIRIKLTKKDKERAEAVRKFILKMEEAHRKAGQSKLRFGTAA
jgi:hypothetical protein